MTRTWAAYETTSFLSNDSWLSHFQLCFLLEDCAELITDPLKVFDSFSVFVEPTSYQRIFHKFGFSVLRNSTLGKILEIHLTLIFGSMGDRLLSKSITRRF